MVIKSYIVSWFIDLVCTKCDNLIYLYQSILEGCQLEQKYMWAIVSDTQSLV
jgi:hypothetical protein